MIYIAIFLFGTFSLFYGAYKLGKRSDTWSVVLAPFLVVAAWYALVNLTAIAQGEGASAGVVVITAGIRFFGTVCVLLALVLLGTSVYLRRDTYTTGVLLCVVLAVLTLGYRLVTARGAGSKAPSMVKEAPRDENFEGYVWAVDNGILTESKCDHGSPAFIAGCKRAVRTNPSLQDRVHK